MTLDEPMDVNSSAIKKPEGQQESEGRAQEINHEQDHAHVKRNIIDPYQPVR